MLKLLPYVLCLGILSSSCNRKNGPSQGIDEVLTIHQNSRTQLTDSAYQELKRAERLLGQSKNIPDSIQAENNYLIGLYFKKKGITDSAAVYFQNATTFVRDSLYLNRQTEYLTSAWNTYASLGLYGDCFEISKKFKKLVDSDKQFRSLIWAYHWEKSTYLMMGDYEKALKVLDTLMEIAIRKDTANIPYVLIGKADLKYNYLNEKKEAFEILEKLLENQENLTYHFQEQINTNYGVYQYFEGNYKKALNHYLKALSAGKKNKESDNYIDALANNYNNIAEVYLDLKEYTNARSYLDSTRLLGIENLSRKKQKALLDYELRFAIATTKDGKEISKLMDKIYTHQDEIYTQRSKKELLALTKANENEKVLLREGQLQEIENIRLETRLLVVLVSTALLGMIGFLFYQRRKLKFEKQTLQNQQRLLRSQMNPHFTFNTLYTIQNKMKTNQKDASDYLMKFSRLLRLILENSTQNYVQLDRELDALRKYLDLQTFRIPGTFNYTIHLENLEEDTLVFIPPMLLQPFVENSLEHGFVGINYPGEINVTLTMSGKFIHCTIEDNGRGMMDHESDSKNSSSIGLISDFIQKASKSKIQIINKSSLEKGQSGVLVKFLIPYRLTEND